MTVMVTVAVAIGSYFTLSALLVKRYYTYDLQYTFHGVEPKDLYKYMSDFWNLMKANPTR